MRLWHKDLLPFLPRQQLLSQLRECVAIAKDEWDLIEITFEKYL